MCKMNDRRIEYELCRVFKTDALSLKNDSPMNKYESVEF